jgi:hypothetical protein
METRALPGGDKSMPKFFSSVVALVALMGATASASLVVSVDPTSFTLAPNQALPQPVHILVSGGDAVSTVNFRVRIDDGKPGAVNRPSITNVDLLDATIFTASHSTPVVQGQSTYWWNGYVTTAGSSTVPASGRLATVYVSTAGIVDGGPWSMYFADRYDNLTNFGLLSCNRVTGQLQFSSGPFSGAADWTMPASGDWSTHANWTDSSNPGIHQAPGVSGNNQTANFGTVAAGSVSIALGTAAPNLGAIHFTGATQYSIDGATGGGGLVMQSAGAAATITTAAGTAATVIADPVSLASNLTADVAAGTSLTFSGPMSGSGALTLVGGGSLTLGSAATRPVNAYRGGTFVNNGTLTIDNAAALSGGYDLMIGAAGQVVLSPGVVNTAAGAVSAGTSPVPEPGTIALLAAVVVAGVAGWLQRKAGGRIS